MEQIKAVIFGLRNLVMEELPEKRGKFDGASIAEFKRFICMLRHRGVEPVLFANDSWLTHPGNKPVEDRLREEWGPFKAFFTSRDSMPRKPTADAMRELLKRLGLKSNEVLYVGNTENDMRTAVNGGVTFLNGVWMNDDNDYGFKFNSVRDLARFIDVFFLARKHAWHFAIEKAGLRYYALAPFSTMMERFRKYSENAVDTAKEAAGSPEFWGHYLCATMLLTGLHAEIDIVSPFPSHTAGHWNEPLRASLDTFAKLFRGKYIPDLVVRHTTALQSRRNRDAMSHGSHLNTLQLTKLPVKNTRTSEAYKNSPLSSAKTVLVIDDICTRGFSIEAARHLLEQKGSKVIVMSWLKTINRGYGQIVKGGKANPFAPSNWTKVKLEIKEHDYAGMIADAHAADELATRFELFDSWEWPAPC